MMLNKLKAIIHFLSNICYILIVLYVIVCVPMIFRYKPLVVLSGSMEPTYKVWSVIYYKNVSKEEIKVNDVITFSYNDKTYITHRIVNIIDEEYETKGDYNDTSDVYKIKYDNIFGKVSNVSIPLIGWYIYFVNTHLYLVIIVLFILVGEFVFSNFKILEKGRK